MIVVSRERNSYLQERPGQTHAAAVPPSWLSPGLVKAVGRGEKRLQTLYKEFVAHDEDGASIGRERVPACQITLLSVETQDITEFGLDTARDCGYTTVQGFRTAWLDRHPRSPLATVVWFAIGDWRDRDLFLAWSGRRAGANDKGYTLSAGMAMDRDAPVPDEIVAVYASHNRQKDEAQRAKLSAALATETPAQRWARVEAYIEHLRTRVGEGAAREMESVIRPHRRIIEQRIIREYTARKRRENPGLSNKQALILTMRELGLSEDRIEHRLAKIEKRR